MKRKAKLRDEKDTLTPSTTRISPQTYRLAALARKTTGPAKSRGSPHRPAGMRSEIWRRRTGSCSSFSFLYVKAESKGSEGRVSIVRLGVVTSAIEGVAAEWSDAVRQRPRYEASSDVEKPAARLAARCVPHPRWCWDALRGAAEQGRNEKAKAALRT